MANLDIGESPAINHNSIQPDCAIPHYSLVPQMVSNEKLQDVSIDPPHAYRDHRDSSTSSKTTM